MNRFYPSLGALTLVAAALTAGSVWGSEKVVRAPLACSRGPDGQTFRATVSVPDTQPTGSEYTVRIDSFPSGDVSHFGLNYLYDMQTDYSFSSGAEYVDGSARVVPNTGTPNVRPGARAWQDADGVHLLLPSRVKKGDSYTPPSLEFRLRMTAAPGTEVALHFTHYHVAVNAAVVGEIHTNCSPEPTPYVIGRTRSSAAR